MEIVHGDALQADLSSATALFLYLVPQVINSAIGQQRCIFRDTDNVCVCVCV